MTSTDFDPSCSFCHIAAGGTGETEVIHASNDWIAFFPLHPATPGHTLVIPKDHVSDYWSAPSTVVRQLTDAASLIGRAIQSALEPDGMNLITSAGATAEQTVFHLHLHLVPRWTRDGFGQIWPPERTWSDATLTGVADRIRAAAKQTPLADK